MKILFDTVSGIRLVLPDSNILRSWRWRALAQSGDELEMR